MILLNRDAEAMKNNPFVKGKPSKIYDHDAVKKSLLFQDFANILASSKAVSVPRLSQLSVLRVSP